MSETSYWLAVAQELFKNNPGVFEEGYSPESLALYLRDGGRCAYCGLDLIQQRQHAYHFISFDHLLPKHEYRHLEDDFTNLVLACRSCNGQKRRWDPNEDRAVYEGTASITDLQRRTLVQRVIDHFRALNTDRASRFERERELILEAMRTLKPTAAAASSNL